MHTPCSSPCFMSFDIVPFFLPHYRINKYFAISAKTVTKALKPDLQVKASRRFITEVKAQQIKNGEVVKATDLSTGKDLAL